MNVLSEIQKRPSFSSQLGANLGQGVSHGIMQARDFADQLKLKNNDRVQATAEGEKLKTALINSGVDPQEADLYVQLNSGSQTQYTKDLLDKRKRAGKVKESFKEFSPEQADEELEEILTNQDAGLTPSEMVSRGKERFASGEKVRAESHEKLRTLSRAKEGMGILDKLNSSGKLPSDLGRLNIDPKTGDLFAPFAATPETQRFVKTLNEFSSGAKDTFGSRVTNFDLTQYLKRFPTLLNSKEGRRQILQQMKIVNDINSVYYKNLNEVYRKAGGARRIDSDVAQDLAERKSEPQIAKLVEKFDTIGQFTSLPNAAEFPGKKIQNPDTGEVLVSDGEEWRPA